MRKIILLSVVVLVAAIITSCGPHTYATKSSGKDNASYVIVLKEAGDYGNVTVMVDDQAYPYGKVYRVKTKRKAHPVIIEPGKHNIKVISNGTVMTDENVFIGLQETKTIILR